MCYTILLGKVQFRVLSSPRTRFSRSSSLLQKRKKGDGDVSETEKDRREKEREKGGGERERERYERGSERLENVEVGDIVKIHK